MTRLMDQTRLNCHDMPRCQGLFGVASSDLCGVPESLLRGESQVIGISVIDSGIRVRDARGSIPAKPVHSRAVGSPCSVSCASQGELRGPRHSIQPTRAVTGAE